MEGYIFWVMVIYPLFFAIGAALGICGYAMARNLAINPDVRITKEDRAAGVLENYKEGEAYKMHGLRAYVRQQEPQIMPGFNNYFSGAK
uniref:Uncharacterized protein n=1 Tax=Physcomitrium patens TaxID=3218 RepID=A0A7I4FP13_PHYPA|nr:uncharacterized protein LOC112280874 isoform X2 [Physcomitrium patens]|eukprot:XP_024372549.1 uncharacterized protein LOC112280874 isoform X2 [Physcomitrella patens]